MAAIGVSACSKGESRDLEHAAADAQGAAVASAEPHASATGSPPAVPAPSSITAEKSPFEASKYGQFEMAVVNEECQISFRPTSGAVKKLFTVSSCGGDVPGVSTIGPTNHVGEVPLPVVGPDGDEFHVFEIAAARGGNATPSLEYWVAVVRSDRVWATKRPFDGELNLAKVIDAKPSSLLLEQSATSTEGGVRHLVSFGKVRETKLPMIAFTVLSNIRTVFDGNLAGGFRATNMRPTITVGETQTIIDIDGPCALPEIGAEGKPVRLTADVAKLSDGRTRVTCVSTKSK